MGSETPLKVEPASCGFWVLASGSLTEAPSADYSMKETYTRDRAPSSH